VASAVGISLVAIGDTISTSGGFAARAGYELRGDQELAGIGSANLAAGFFSGFPVTTSSSRTAVAFQSGARTQLTGLVAAALVLAMLLFVPGLVQDMPQPVLAAVVIAASISLFDVAELRRLWRARKAEFGLAIASLLGVAFVGVLQGIVVAVVLSVFYIFKRAWSPYSAILGHAGTHGWHDVRRFPDAEQIPGLLVVRWSAPLFFANANQFRERIRSAIKEAIPPPRWVLIAAEPITDVDTTASAMLVDLDEELAASGIVLAFAEVQSPVRDWIVRYGASPPADRARSYRSLDEAVDVYLRETGGRAASAARPDTGAAASPGTPGA
jgi:MFS superfamily sulfate permease-like transporter